MKSIQSSNWQNLIECFGPLALGCPSCINAILSESRSTDDTLIAVTSIICRLEAVMAAEYAIKHDRSKNLEKSDKYFSQLISHEAPVSFRTTMINRLSFPLKLKSVVQLDSKCSFGVQVADIMAGGIVDSSKAISKVKVNDYNLKIAGLYKDFQLIHLLPSLNVEEEVCFRKGTKGER